MFQELKAMRQTSKKSGFYINNMIENLVRNCMNQMEMNNNNDVRILYEPKGNIIVQGERKAYSGHRR